MLNGELLNTAELPSIQHSEFKHSINESAFCILKSAFHRLR